MNFLETLSFYFYTYHTTILLSCFYFIALSFIGLFFIFRRSSVFGLVLTSSAKFAFVLGLLLLSYGGFLNSSLLEDPSFQNRFSAFFQLDMFVFPIIFLVLFFIILVGNRLQSNHRNIETFYLIVFVSLLSLTTVLQKISGEQSHLLIRSYYTEILYTPPELFSYYLCPLLAGFFIFFLFWKRIFLAGFDSEQAKLLHLNPVCYQFLFYLLAGMIISFCVRLLGFYVSLAFLLIPAYTASLCFRSLRSVLVFTCIFSLLFSNLGFFAIFILDNLPSDPILIIVLSFLSLITIGIKKILRLF